MRECNSESQEERDGQKNRTETVLRCRKAPLNLFRYLLRIVTQDTALEKKRLRGISINVHKHLD